MFSKSVLALIICVNFAFSVQLPAVVDIESAPVALPSADMDLPVFDCVVGENAPAISAISENTLPDETLVMSGYNLKDASLKIWSQGKIANVEPLVSENDRLTAVVPLNLPAATMLVWPQRAGVYGIPIRVNGPAAWWCFPEQVAVDNKPQTLKVMGKNFVIGEFKPVAYVKGDKFADFVEIKKANPYQVELALGELKEGEYKVWIHNGSGGDYGWSYPVSFNVVAAEKAGKIVRVEDFGAVANDGKDDGEAIEAAAKEAAQVSGGVLAFSAGTYMIKEPVDIDGDNVHLRGAGKGSYEKGEERVGGESTVIRYLDVKNIPDALIRFNGSDCSIEAMTVINASDGSDQNVLVFNKPNVKADNVRVIMFDKRQWGYDKPGPWQRQGAKRDMKKITKKIIDKGAILIDTSGYANVHITNCEVHAVGPGIQVGRFTGWETSKSKPLSESVLIDNVKFYGYYSGEPDGKPNVGASGRATGIVMYSGRKVAVENCSFEGVDRFNAKTMCRTILAFNSYGRYYYFADNQSKNVGPHPSAIGMSDNQGEQYLMHYRSLHGGLFDVVNAQSDSLTFTTANVKSFEEEERAKKTTNAEKNSGQNWNTKNPHFYYDNRGGQVLDEVKDDQNWILYVSKGKGAGQYRAITAFIQKGDLYKFKINKDWRVVPDFTSRVHLMPAYRYIVIYNNFVDTGKLVEETKTHGVCLWFYNFDNIVADNTFKNLTSGIIINSRFSGPTGWNTTRGNLIENISGYAGDTSETAAGYVDHFRLTLQWPEPNDRLWYQVGNVFRDNTIKNSTVGVYLHTRYTGYVRTKKPDTVPHPDSGIMMSVIEHNKLINVGEGIVLSSPLNTSVVRENEISVTGSKPAVYNQDADERLVDVVIMDNITK